MSLRWPWQPATALDEARWLVVDVETSGLDPHQDELLAIAGVALQVQASHAQIRLDDSFEVFLRPRKAVHDKHNILLHGIGLQAQQGGTDPAQALEAFRRWAGRSPLLGFHSGFDETMLNRACALAGVEKWPNPWLDLAPVLRELFKADRHLALDDWLARFQIHCPARHRAAADALVTAQLGLMVLQQWRAAGKPLTFKALQRMAEQARWLQAAP
jgi:DNA polymerase III subunit epsilon